MRARTRIGQRRVRDRIAERADPLAQEDDPEVAVAAERRVGDRRHCGRGSQVDRLLLRAAGPGRQGGGGMRSPCGHGGSTRGHGRRHRRRVRSPSMQFAIQIPNFGSGGDPPTLVELARRAEDAGWDGFFVWDHLLVDPTWTLEIADPWIALAAIAQATTRIRLGPMVAALPRRRPAKLARETASLDRLSGGRLILGVGLGWPSDADFGWFGDETDLARRGAMVDESLAILEGLWSGEPFAFAGDHYRIGEAIVPAATRPGAPDPGLGGGAPPGTRCAAAARGAVGRLRARRRGRLPAAR